MNNKNLLLQFNRRKFLKAGAALAASSVLLPLSGCAKTDSETSALNIPNVALNNGLAMPVLGFGTYTLTSDTCVRCVSEAISLGYRLFDTATIYGNEEEVGAGIKLSGVQRDKLFITSKLWVDDSGYETTKKAFQTSLDKLGTHYLDLYLIHRPRGDVKGTWLAMEELYKEGKIKAIGLSNFLPDQLEALQEYATVTPTVNQIETHAFFQQKNDHEVMTKNKIQTEAWAPFAEGRNGLFTNSTLAEIAKKYNKSNAQVSLRWHLQRGIVAIPRTVQKAHMIENLSIFDFKLSDAEMQKIAAIDLNVTQFPEWE